MKNTISLGEESWEFDDEDLTLADAFVIKANTGYAIRQFQDGLNDYDPLALQCLIWFLRRRDGHTGSMDSVQFKLKDFKVVPAEDPTEGDETPSSGSGTA